MYRTFWFSANERIYPPLCHNFLYPILKNETRRRDWRKIWEKGRAPKPVCKCEKKIILSTFPASPRHDLMILYLWDRWSPEWKTKHIPFVNWKQWMMMKIQNFDAFTWFSSTAPSGISNFTPGFALILTFPFKTKPIMKLSNVTKRKELI